MIQSLLILGAFLGFAVVVYLLVRWQRLTLRYAFVGISLGFFGAVAAVIVPRSKFINTTLGVSPTGALLALFSGATTVLLILLAILVNDLRRRQERLVTELALQGYQIGELQNSQSDEARAGDLDGE